MCHHYYKLYFWSIFHKRKKLMPAIDSWGLVERIIIELIDHGLVLRFMSFLHFVILTVSAGFDKILSSYWTRQMKTVVAFLYHRAHPPVVQKYFPTQSIQNLSSCVHVMLCLSHCLVKTEHPNQFLNCLEEELTVTVGSCIFSLSGWWWVCLRCWEEQRVSMDDVANMIPELSICMCLTEPSHNTAW